MEIENNKIIEATEEELMEVYLSNDWDLIMSFRDYVSECVKNGTKVI